ncbi:Trypsin-3, partial [Eumeta japonica]
MGFQILWCDKQHAAGYIKCAQSTAVQFEPSLSVYIAFEHFKHALSVISVAVLDSVRFCFNSSIAKSRVDGCCDSSDWSAGTRQLGLLIKAKVASQQSQIERASRHTKIQVLDRLIFDDGQPEEVSNSRIVGGEESTIEDHPYQVSFIVNNSYFCGGFIVSKDYILTAAHCSQNVDPSTVVLRAGSTWRKNGTIIPIAEVTPHPEYDNPAFDKDVAVMRTVSPIEFTDTIQPVPLPTKGRPMRGRTDVCVIGWGRMK